MGFSINLLKAPHVGIREVKEQISKKYLDEVLVITDRGQPISVNLPYEDLLELMDIIEEMTDTATLQTIHQGRQAIQRGTEGIDASKLFQRIRKHHA